VAPAEGFEDQPEASEALRLSVAKIVLRVVIRFTVEEVLAHLGQHHPSCPARIKRHIARRVATDPWIDASLGQAVGITMQNIVRHDMTNYH